MLQTKKINKDIVAVSSEPTEILLRKSGKEYLGKEKVLLYIKDDTLYINMGVARKFGISVVKNMAGAE